MFHNYKFKREILYIVKNFLYLDLDRSLNMIHVCVYHESFTTKDEKLPNTCIKMYENFCKLYIHQHIDIVASKCKNWNDILTLRRSMSLVRRSEATEGMSSAHWQYSTTILSSSSTVLQHIM